ncbi:GAF domain-containing sensor histidine kinase [Ekhidna sp.]|uniref:GAF domain-containing sensor histidine kinase n=1 Tax=Ekhidna sp. TaxID=2608089 RepID=UPI0032EC43A8
MNDAEKSPSGHKSESHVRSQLEMALAIILKAGTITESKRFFEFLVEELAKLMDVHWVTIARMDKEGFGELVAIASWEGGHQKEKFDYSIKNTACEVLYSTEQLTCFPSKLTEQFPDNHFYQSHGVQSYMGVPLNDRKGNLIGHLYLMDKRPIEIAPWVESVVGLFAQTAQSELLRFLEERKSKNFNQTLEKLVMSRTQKLFATISELDTLFYKASHDLREPVVALKGISSMLRYELSGIELPASIDMLENQIEKLERLNVQLIDIGVIRKHEPSFSRLDLKTLLQKVSEEIPECSRDYIDFAFPSNKRIRTDEKMLSLICYHLISNSIKYSLPDKPKIRISTVGSYLIFEDEGSGIPSNQVNNLTNMFFKAHTHSGMGLGLYKSKLAAEKIRAKLNFESDTGKGTKAWLEFNDQNIDA